MLSKVRALQTDTQTQTNAHTDTTERFPSTPHSRVVNIWTVCATVRKNRHHF